MPDLDGNLTDGDRAATDMVKAHAPTTKSSWLSLSVIAVGCGVSYGIWDIPALLAATVIFVGWAVIAFTYHVVQVALGITLTNASRLQVIEGKIDKAARDREADRTAKYRDGAQF